MTLAPVVVFAYSRPDHLRRVLDALTANPPSRSTDLWVFSDGPRNESVAESVAEVRRLLRGLAAEGAFATVNVIESAHNKGLARSIIDGVTQVVDRYGSVVVLEDDVVVAPDFLDFMNQALHFYQSDERVGSVTGLSPIARLPADYSASVYLAPRNSSTGWGTWRDRWGAVRWDAPGYEDVLDDPALRRAFDRCGSDRSARLARQMTGKVDSWSIRFGYWQFREGRGTIYPVVNRVENIGYDGTGMNSRAGEGRNPPIPAAPVPFTLQRVEEDPRIVRQLRRIYSGGSLGRLRRWAAHMVRPRLAAPGPP